MSASVHYDEHVLPLTGEYSWERLDHISLVNSSSSAAEYEITLVERETLSKKQLLEHVVRQTKDISFESSQGVKIGSGELLAKLISVEVKGDDTHKVATQYYEDTRFLSEEDTTKESSRERKYTVTVAPGDAMSVYQLKFHGPGVTISCENHQVVVQSGPAPIEPNHQVELLVCYGIRPNQFLSNLTVEAYTDDHVSSEGTIVQEGFGESNDINRKFKGKFTYLRKHFTNDPEEAVRHIAAVFSEDAIPGLGGDMAEGAGGLFRYIRTYTRRDGYIGAPVNPYELFLWRSENSDGWPRGCTLTKDLNKYRGGDYLWLGWKTV